MFSIDCFARPLSLFPSNRLSVPQINDSCAISRIVAVLFSHFRSIKRGASLHVRARSQSDFALQRGTYVANSGDEWSQSSVADKRIQDKPLQMLHFVPYLWRGKWRAWCKCEVSITGCFAEKFNYLITQFYFNTNVLVNVTNVLAKMETLHFTLIWNLMITSCSLSFRFSNIL